ncbi:MAG: hypothetical protein LUF78_11925 [Clostridiales bacterium]|nr:hypothetical protein [Clostridiales bacterium]
MKKRMIALLLIMVMLLAVVGCASESSTDKPGTGSIDFTTGNEQDDSGSHDNGSDIILSGTSTGTIPDSLAEISSEYFQEAE